MMNIAKKMRRYLASSDGPTAVEYVVLLALFSIVCITVIKFGWMEH